MIELPLGLRSPFRQRGRQNVEAVVKEGKPVDVHRLRRTPDTQAALIAVENAARATGLVLSLRPLVNTSAPTELYKPSVATKNVARGAQQVFLGEPLNPTPTADKLRSLVENLKKLRALHPYQDHPEKTWPESQLRYVDSLLNFVVQQYLGIMQADVVDVGGHLIYKNNQLPQKPETEIVKISL